MKSKIKILILIIVCIFLVAVLSLINQRRRISVPQNMIRIEGTKSNMLDLSTLPRSKISGKVVNNKGDVREISGDGISLFDLIKDYAGDNYSKITVISDDEYKAIITRDEAEIPGRAILIFEDSTMRLYVFGDANSKRNVSNVKRIIIN